MSSSAASKPVLVVVNKVDDERREADVWAFAEPRPRRPVPGLGDPRAGERRPARRARRRAAARSPRSPRPSRRRRSSRSRSSAGPTSASRRCSTGSSATTARSCTTCPARRATRSTRSSRPRTGRCASSTPRACAAGAGSTSRPSTTASCARSQAVDRADAALLVIDATEGVTHQDQRLAERIDAAGTAIVIVLNKWDLLDAEGRAAGRDRRRRPARLPRRTRRCSRSRRSPGSMIAAHAARRCARPRRRTTTRIPTAALNRVIRDAQAAHPPPPVRQAPARGSSTRPRARPIRRRSRCSPPTSFRPRTCATSSARSARRSTSAPRRSSSGSAAATSLSRVARSGRARLAISWLKARGRLLPTQDPAELDLVSRSRDVENGHETYSAGSARTVNAERSSSRPRSSFPSSCIITFGLIEFSSAYQSSSTGVGAARSAARTASAEAMLPNYATDAAAAAATALKTVGPRRAGRDVDLQGQHRRLSRRHRRTGFATCATQLHQVRRGSPRPRRSTPPTRPAAAGRTTTQNACDVANWDSVGVYIKLNHKFITKLFGATINLTDHAVFRLEPAPTAAVRVADVIARFIRRVRERSRPGARLLHGVVRADVRHAHRVRRPRARVQPVEQHRDPRPEGRRRRRARRRGLHARERRQQGVHHREDDRDPERLHRRHRTASSIIDRGGQAAEPAEGHDLGADQEPVGRSSSATTTPRSCAARWPSTSCRRTSGARRTATATIPSRPLAQPQFWGNIFGPSSSKGKGDAIQSSAPAASATLCDADNCPSGVNKDYDANGYFYGIDVPAGATGALNVQVFDPAFVHVGDNCGDSDANAQQQPRTTRRRSPRRRSPATRGTITPARALRIGELERVLHRRQLLRRRRATTLNPWTIWTLRAPDVSTWDPTNNPIVCQAEFPGVYPESDATTCRTARSTPTRLKTLLQQSATYPGTNPARIVRVVLPPVGAASARSRRRSRAPTSSRCRPRRRSTAPPRRTAVAPTATPIRARVGQQLHAVEQPASCTATRRWGSTRTPPAPTRGST